MRALTPRPENAPNSAASCPGQPREREDFSAARECELAAEALLDPGREALLSALEDEPEPLHDRLGRGQAAERVVGRQLRDDEEEVVH
eukprot:884958-Lingulodinium_polyedra.AAC.1